MNKKLLEMRRKMLVEKSKYLSDYTIYGNTVVEDGVIKGVGDEVKWNQLCLMPIPTEVLPSGVNVQFATYTYSDGIGEIQRTSDTEAYRIGFNIPTTIKTDKYLIYITARAGDGEEFNCNVQFDWGYASSIKLTENFKTYSVFKNPYGSNTAIRLITNLGTKLYIKGLLIINLTEMFGAGNEPNTIEDFKSYLVSIGKMKSVEDDIPYFPYDTGSVFYKMPIVAYKDEYNKLPEGYTECEYLESTGTQYIDTGINPNIKPRVVANLAFTRKNFDTDFWGNNNLDGSAYYSNFAYCGLRYQRYGSLSYFGSSKTAPINEFHIWDVSDKCYLDGNLLFSTSNVYTYNPAQSTILVFAAWRNNNAIWYKSAYRLNSFELYDGDNIVRNFIPALDNTGKPCLYDTISQTPFYNQGTGEFLYKVKEQQPVVYPVSLSKPLYKIGDITDYASYSARGVWRNLEYGIFNGSENWKYSSGDNGFYLDSGSIYVKMKRNGQAISSRFRIRVGSGWRPLIYDDGLFAGDVNAFKADLQANPLYVIYEPNDIIFEPVDLPKITKFDGIELTTDTEVKPSKVEIR